MHKIRVYYHHFLDPSMIANMIPPRNKKYIPTVTNARRTG